MKYYRRDLQSFRKDGLQGAYVSVYTVYAIYLNKDEFGYDGILIAMSSIDDETSLSGQEHPKLLKFVLPVQNLRRCTVIALFSDQLRTNRAFSCYSHRFNRATKDYWRTHELMLRTVQALMRKRSCSTLSAPTQYLYALAIIFNSTRCWLNQTDALT